MKPFDLFEWEYFCDRHPTSDLPTPDLVNAYVNVRIARTPHASSRMKTLVSGSMLVAVLQQPCLTDGVVCEYSGDRDVCTLRQRRLTRRRVGGKWYAPGGVFQ